MQKPCDGKCEDVQGIFGSRDSGREAALKALALKRCFQDKRTRRMETICVISKFWRQIPELTSAVEV